MHSDPPDAERCSLCGRPLSAGGESPTAGEPFCSAGCRTVHETLGERADRATGTRATEDDGQRAHESVERAGDRAYLRVDGMHSTTCEDFLADLTERQDGVTGARASYVTETVRVDYDSDRTSVADLTAALSTLGYTAYPRDAETDDDATGVAGPQQNPRRHQERGLGDMLGFRYAVGVLFGTFLLLPYVALLYPTYLSEFVDWGFLAQFSRTVTFTGKGGLFILRVYLILTSIVLVFTGMPLLRSTYVSLRTRRPNTTVLVTLTVVAAFAYSTVAALVGRPDVYFDLTVVVAAVVVAAIFYESLSKQRAMDRLTELTVAQVDEATLYDPNGNTSTVSVADLTSGDRVLVREGDRIPVDGTLESGPCTVDEAVVSGESLPVSKAAGEEVVGGAIVTDGAAVVRVGQDATSSIDRLVTSVWDVQSGTHGVQRRANRLAARLAPLTVVVAVLVTATAVVTGAGLTDGILAGLTAIIVACPWALGLATPLSVATSIEAATERGLVVFDETVFERLQDTDVVVFDKTGTLTTGEMTVVDADTPASLLRVAGKLEQRASHPAASAIASAFDDRVLETDGGDGERTADPGQVSEFTSYANGVGGVVDGSEVLVGNLDCFADQGWSVGADVESRVADAHGFGRLPVVVGRDGRAEGVVVVGDEPRAGWDDVVTRLGERNVTVVVLTGDDEAATDFFRDHPFVEHVFARVPPAGKTAAIRRLQQDGHVTMVGDGTNDAPALARADLGVSLGSGTAIASDAADLAIVDDDLTAVETAFELARAARRRVSQNTTLALLYNALLVPLAVAGLLNPLVATAAVCASCVAIGANSFRRFPETVRR